MITILVIIKANIGFNGIKTVGVLDDRSEINDSVFYKRTLSRLYNNNKTKKIYAIYVSYSTV